MVRGRKIISLMCAIAILLTLFPLGVTVKADDQIVQQTEMPNIAFGKPTVASSTDGGYTADKVFDGIDYGSNPSDPNNNKWGAGWGKIAGSWIYVDLGKDYNISSLKISWEWSYATDYKVQVASRGSDPAQDSSYTDVLVYGQSVSGGQVNRTTSNAGRLDEITLNQAVTGEYVRIYVNDTVQYDQKYAPYIWEAYVYGTEIPENLALNKQALASTVDGYKTADLALDGLDFGRRDPGVTHDNFWGAKWGDVQGAWLRVDLGANYHVNRFRISWEYSYAASYEIKLAPYGSDPSNDNSYTTVLQFTEDPNGDQHTVTGGNVIRTYSKVRDPQNPGGVECIEQVNLGSMATAEYIKIVVNDVAVNGTTKYPPGIYELEAYGENMPLLNPNGYIDDLTDFSKAAANNMVIDTSSPDTYNKDASRAARAAMGEANIIYTAGYDIARFTINAFVKTAGQPLTGKDYSVSCSADGTTYSPIDAADIRQFATSVNEGNGWPVTVICGNAPAGTRYLKLSLADTAAAAADNLQISRVVINNEVGPVSANIPSGKFEGALDITLDTVTTGAAIKYVLSTDPYTVKDYTGPIHITNSMTITAYAKKSGLLDSTPIKYKYISNASLIVDKYGQFRKVNFAAKVTSDQELLDDAVADQAYYGSLKPPERDIYGGLPESKEQYGLEAKGFFNIQKLNGKFVMVDPIGNLYFSLGANGVGYGGDTFTQVSGREDIYEWLPGIDSEFASAFLNGNPAYFSFYAANRIKKFGKPFSFYDFYLECVDRMRKWGFNSEGGFSNPPAEGNTTNFPQVKFADLPKGFEITGSNLFDIYRPDAVQAIADALVTQKIAERKDDPLIIGYFFGNEFGYQSFKKVVPNAKASQVATKEALVTMLENEYSDIASFNAAWETSFASFADMREAAIAVRTEAASNDMDKFFEQYLEKFYSTISTEFRKADPNHMLLGDRYLKNTMNYKDIRDMVCKVAGKYIDVLSYNYYTFGLDLERIKSMSELSGRPIMFTEFHYCDPTQGQAGSVITVDNEDQKGKGYRSYVEQAAASGYVVGTHWFALTDQSVTGRWFQGYEGEGFGHGLLNVADRPYKQMLESVMAANYNIYDLILGKKDPYSYDFGGRYERNSDNKVNIMKVDKPIVIDGIKDASWPSGNTLKLEEKDKLFGSHVPGVSADIDLAWDQTKLYIFAHVKDNTPMQNAFEGADIWNGDALELFTGPNNLNSPGAARVSDSQIIMSATGLYHWYNNKTTQPEIGLATKLDENGLGYTLEAAVPLSGLNIDDAANGRQMRFDIGFDNGEGNSRIAQYLWNGVDENLASRDRWGMATLQENSTSGPAASGSVTSEKPPETDKPTMDKDGNVSCKLNPVPDNKMHTATVEIGEKLLDSMLEMAKKDSKGVKTISFDIQKAENANTYLQKFPANALYSEAGELKIKINTPIGTALVPGNMFASEPEYKAKKIDISMGIADTSELDQKVKDAIGNRPVIELKAEIDGKPVEWSNPEASVMFTFDYKPTKEELEDPDHIVVWYINSKGEAISVPSGRYHPETGKVSFETTHFSKYSIAYSKKTFSDAGKYAWAKVPIEVVASKGILEGFSSDKFGSDGNITRGEFIAGIIKALGLTAKVDSNFDDVKATYKFYNEIGIAKKLGIAAGHKNKFAPEQNISRQDMMVLIAKALKYAGKVEKAGTDEDLSRFKDKAKIASYAKDSIATLVKYGVIQGEGNNINPKGTLSRASAAVVLYKLLKL